MAAGTHDFTIEQGATFTLSITWKDSAGALMNLTGYTARMQLRKKLSSSAFIVELTTENGGLALGGAAGTVTLLLTAAQTAAINDNNGVYDLELIAANGLVTRLLEGAVTIHKEVTR